MQGLKGTSAGLGWDGVFRIYCVQFFVVHSIKRAGSELRKGRRRRARNFCEVLYWLDSSRGSLENPSASYGSPYKTTTSSSLLDGENECSSRERVLVCVVV